MTSATAPRRDGAVVGVLAGAGIMVSLMQTLVVPLIPELPTLLHTSASNASWVVTATLLAGAVATPVAGRLGDLYGKRRVMVASTLFLVLGSLICALTSSLVPQVAGRALQGMGVGLIPLGISIMRDALPPQKLGSAVGMMSSSLGVGGALGLPLAAIVAQHTDWHVLYWGSAGLGLIVAALLVLFVPSPPRTAHGRFDVVGALGLSIGLVCLLLPISKGGDWGWATGRTLGLLGASVVVLLVWGWWELRTTDPLVDLRTTARRQVLMTNLASVVVGFATYAMALIAPQVLELPTASGYGLGQSLTSAGLWLVPSGLAMMAVAPLGARISAARGAKVTLLTGSLVICIGYVLGLLLMAHTWGVLIFSIIVGAGVGIAYGAMPALIMGAVPVTETAAANGLNTLFRSIGSSSSAAVVGVVLAHMTTHLGPAIIPTQNAFRTSFVIAGAGALLAALVTLAIPGRRARHAAAGASAPAEEKVPSWAVASTEAAPDGTQKLAAVATLTPPTSAGESGGGVPVRGFVRGAGSAPVARAAVTLISLGGRQLGRSVTKADGSYAVDAPGTGSYFLVASADGYQPQASTVLVHKEPAAYDILLSGTSGLSGVVRAAETVLPVKDAMVIVTDVRGDLLATAATGEHGEFSFAELVPGSVILAVNAAGHRPRALPVEVGATGVTRIEIDLDSGAQVQGVVRAPHGPLADARVTLVDGAGNVVGTARTGADGAYAFTDLNSDEYTVIAMGYPPMAAAVMVSGRGVDDHDIELAYPGE
ncbi:MFS transporter [Streptomyces sp. NPDC001978]|uniref:MFS transporter n=1 Tax=Streptomyces sp. NPDC001978 TaxID=3364627 RepID=UPI0036798421